MSDELCPRMTDLLGPFLDGELPHSEAHLVAEHLRHCGACRMRLEQEQNLNALLAELPEAPPRSVLLRTLAAKERLLARRSRIRRWGAAAALLVVACTGALLGLREVRKEQESRFIRDLPAVREVEALLEAGGEDLLGELELVEAVYELSQEPWQEENQEY